jgi:hypothetical protein
VDKLSLLFLKAASEMNTAKNEIVPFLAKEFAVNTNELFFPWKKIKLQSSVGSFMNGTWKYFFHGLECDVQNISDKRFLCIEFGPGGRIDTFTGYGVLLYIMASCSPWPDYLKLKEYLAEKGPPYDYLSGSHSKMCMLVDQLEENNLVQPADQELCDFVEKCSYRDENGSMCVKLPDSLTFEQELDTSVCDRLIISEKGFNAIKALNTNKLA